VSSIRAIRKTEPGVLAAWNDAIPTVPNFSFDTWTIADIYKHYNHFEYPAYQRSYTWNGKNRSDLIEHIMRGYPLPGLFMRKRADGKLEIFDGRQRITTLALFNGLFPDLQKDPNNAFKAFLSLESGERAYPLSYQSLSGSSMLRSFLSYRIGVSILEGSEMDALHTFIAINTHGKRLNKSTVLNAVFSDRPVLAGLKKLYERHSENLKSYGILSTASVSNMKYIEILADLVCSVHRTCDSSFYSSFISSKNVSMFLEQMGEKKASESITEVSKVLDIIFSLFEAKEFRNTAFRKMADFYTLFSFVRQMLHHKADFDTVRRDPVFHAKIRQFSMAIQEGRKGDLERNVSSLDVASQASNIVPSIHEYMIRRSLGCNSSDARKIRHDITLKHFGPLFMRTAPLASTDHLAA